MDIVKKRSKLMANGIFFLNCCIFKFAHELVATMYIDEKHRQKFNVIVVLRLCFHLQTVFNIIITYFIIIYYKSQTAQSNNSV